MCFWEFIVHLRDNRHHVGGVKNFTYFNRIGQHSVKSQNENNGEKNKHQKIEFFPELDFHSNLKGFECFMNVTQLFPQ